MRLTVPIVLSLLVAACTAEMPAQCESSSAINGTDQFDRLAGGPGNDCLYGKEGTDILDGAGGDDFLVGGAGSDVLAGGSGNDTFVIELGDGLDVIADEEGDDTIQFGNGITPESLAVLDEAGVFVVQVEQDGEWAYVTVAPGDSFISASESASEPASPVENFVFADGTRLSYAELAAAVEKVALPVSEFSAKLVQEATVTVSVADVDDDLFRAVSDSVRASGSPALCLRPSPYPKPDAMGKSNGMFWPDEYFVVLYGEPEDDRARQQREEFRSLAFVGIMQDQPVVSPEGVPGEKYTLTWDGWGYFDRQGCIHYGTLGVQEIESYLPTKRQVQGMELYMVKARVAATNVDIWARQPIIARTFPKTAADLDGRTIEAIVLKDGDRWVAATSNGTPMPNRLPAVGELPGNSELLAVEDRRNSGTLGDSIVCTRLPLLGSGKFDQPGSPYVTFTRYPFEGGHAKRNEEQKRYLDMLVRFGVATEGLRYEVDRNGRNVRYIEYRMTPEVTVRRDLAVNPCMEVAATSIEILHARWSRPGAIVVRGRKKATASYDWVRDPAFLAEHPELVPMLGEGRPLVATIDAIDGQPMRTSGATMSNLNR